MKPQFVIHIEEQIVLGAARIADRIGYRPEDIKALVADGRLKAWQIIKPNGTWRTLPEYITEFNQAEADRHLKK